MKKEKNYSLFIDASTTNCGIAILENTRQTPKVYMHSISLHSQRPSSIDSQDYLKWKFSLLKHRLDELQSFLKISKVYIEGIYIHPKHRKSSEVLLKLHGFLLGYFLDVPTYYVSPSVIKKEIAGKGNAKKEDVEKALKNKYKITFLDNDQVDAFALLVTVNGIKNYQITLKND